MNRLSCQIVGYTHFLFYKQNENDTTKGLRLTQGYVTLISTRQINTSSFRTSFPTVWIGSTQWTDGL